jgi:virginiamycin B lyase
MRRTAILAALATIPILAQSPAREAWAVNRAEAIFRQSGGQWTQIPGLLKWVSLGADGAVWGVNGGDAIYRWTGTGWEWIPGLLSQISVGNARTVWGVNSGGAIYRRDGDVWTHIPTPKSMRHVSASSDGAVWALDTDEGIWTRNGDAWRQVGGLLRQISVGNAQAVWGVSAGNEIWRFSPGTQGWEKMPGLLVQISVSADGEVWGSSPNGLLYRWNGSNWDNMGVAYAQVSVGAAQSSREEESNTTTFTYNGSWAPASDAKASGGAHRVSSAGGSSVTFNVTGNNFVLYRKVEPNGGFADVTVDGRPFGSLTFYFPETRWQIPAVVDHLGPGSHTIKLTVSTDRPTGSGGTNVSVDALESPAPAAFGPTQAQTDAVSRTNFYRSLMSIPPVRHHLALGLGATAHAKYLSDADFIANGTSPHVETFAGNPNFTGAQPRDRAAYFGFTGTGVGEDANNTPDPIAFVDGWMDGVDHRQPFLIYGSTEIGFGGYPKGSAINFASRVDQPLAPPEIKISTFPADGQTDVWLRYDGSDGPTGLGRGSYGYPISLVIAYPADAKLGTAAKVPTTMSLVNAAGNAVPVRQFEVSGHYIMIPLQPLATSTVYTARIAGTDAFNNSFDKTWKFTTANPNSVHAVRAALGNRTFIYSINWDMPGATVASQLEFGPTPAYGNVLPGELFPGRQTTFRALLPGVLTYPGGIHYRVTAKDAQGNVYTSPGHFIAVDKVLTPGTVGFVNVSPDADNTFFQWETAGPVESTQIHYGLTPNYGKSETATAYGGYSTWFYLDLFDLTPGATYHYQIVTKDKQGNTVTSPDATFTIP